MDKHDKWIQWSTFQRMLFATVTYVTSKKYFFGEERLLSYIINSLLTSLARSVQ